jgi:hypothetical protein
MSCSCIVTENILHSYLPCRNAINEVVTLIWLKHLEEENRKLKHMFADFSLENQVIKEMLRKK